MNSLQDKIVVAGAIMAASLTEIEVLDLNLDNNLVALCESLLTVLGLHREIVPPSSAGQIDAAKISALEGRAIDSALFFKGCDGERRLGGQSQNRHSLPKIGIRSRVKWHIR